MSDAYNEPYKSPDTLRIVQVPAEVEVPQHDSEIAKLAEYIFQTDSRTIDIQGHSDVRGLLPGEYVDLERFFDGIYRKAYSDGLSVDLSPRNLDFLFQQYGITMDEVTNQIGFNTFGLYALSYLDGLRTMGVRQGYLGKGGWSHITKDKYQGLLLGCSSITTASDYFRFMLSLNPQNEAIITDIDPLAVRLAKNAVQDGNRQHVIQSDVQRIPLRDGSVDFICTNFLVPNLIDIENAGVDTLWNVMSEVGRILSSEGRLIMVEQLSRDDLRSLTDFAYQSGLTLSTGGPGGGILRTSTRFSNHSEATRAMSTLPEFIDESMNYDSHRPVEIFSIDPLKYFEGVEQQGVTTLIFNRRS